MRNSIFRIGSIPFRSLPLLAKLEVDDRAFAHIYTYAYTYTYSYTYIRNAALLLYCRLLFLLFARFSERTKKWKRGDRQTAANEFGARDCQTILFLSTLFEYVRSFEPCIFWVLIVSSIMPNPNAKYFMHYCYVEKLTPDFSQMYYFSHV